MDSLLESPGRINGYINEPVKILPQYLAAGSASIFVMIAGTVLGWTSPVLPKLMDANSTLPLTFDESTWVGSLVAVGSFIGPFPAGICADMMGRKKALLLVAVPFLAAWCILTAATSVLHLYIGRLISGFSMGWGMTVLPMYVGEIATAEIRGALSVLGQILMTFGFLYVYSIGPFVSYTWFCIACAVVPVVFAASFAFMPESPYYFIEKGDRKAASSALQKLRGQSDEGIKEELESIQNAVDESLKNEGSWSDLFRVKGNFRAVYLLFGLQALQQLSGINVIFFYSETIFEAAGSSLSPSISTLLIGVVQFLASFATPYLIERLGRRILLIGSALGMLAAQIVLGIYAFMDTQGVDVSRYGWISLAGMMTYIVLYSVGVGPIPWALIGELLSPSVRSKGAALTASFSWFLAFLMTKLFGEVIVMIGVYAAFFAFATSCGIGAIFVFICLPETQGKTLQQIQDILNNRSSR